MPPSGTPGALRRTAEQAAWRLMERLPPGADGLLRAARRAALTLAERRLPLTRLNGTAAGATGPARLIVAGRGGTLDYLAGRFLANEPRREDLGEVALQALPARLREAAAGADLAIARVPRRAAARLAGNTLLVVPEAVGARLKVHADGTTFKTANATARRNIRQVEKRGFTWTVTHAPDAFEHFYDAMYTPFARGRYGDNAFLRPRAAMRRRFRQGGLLEARLNGAVVAAQLFRLEGDVLEMLGPGTLHGDPEPVRQGAFSALYVFAEAYARERGLEWLDFGASMPSLSDGVLRHKRGWGARIVDRVEADHDLLLTWNGPSPALEAFLAATPLVFRDGQGLSALVAETDGAKEREAPGLRRVRTLPATPADLAA